MRQLRHPNIIRVHDVWKSKSTKGTYTINILMEYADSGTLKDRMDKKKSEAMNYGGEIQYFSEEKVLFWFTQVCLAVERMHTKKLLHRDIKTENVFMKSNGLIKLGDFGLTTNLSGDKSKTMSQTGTLHYMAPEIFDG